MAKFITPVSMRVTQEQFEQDLKNHLEKMGYSFGCMTHFENCPILVNNYNGSNFVCTNVHEEVKNDRSRHFIDHYNPKLFLALAAMTGEKFGSVGEWWVCTSEIAGFTKDKLYDASRPINEHLAFLGDNGEESGVSGLDCIKYFRKATKDELIAHFSNAKLPVSNPEVLPKRQEILSEISDLRKKLAAIRKGTDFRDNVLGNIQAELVDIRLDMLEMWVGTAN